MKATGIKGGARPLYEPISSWAAPHSNPVPRPHLSRRSRSHSSRSGRPAEVVATHRAAYFEFDTPLNSPAGSRAITVDVRLAPLRLSRRHLPGAAAYAGQNPAFMAVSMWPQSATQYLLT